MMTSSLMDMLTAIDKAVIAVAGLGCLAMMLYGLYYLGKTDDEDEAD